MIYTTHIIKIFHRYHHGGRKPVKMPAHKNKMKLKAKNGNGGNNSNSHVMRDNKLQSKFLPFNLNIQRHMKYSAMNKLYTAHYYFVTVVCRC